MLPNELADNATRYGLDMVGVRGALRDMRTAMIAEGDGHTVGVHDFGVFYVHQNVERFVVREGEVFKVPARLVLKLRPEKSEPDKLTESDDVRINQDFDFGAGSVPWQFKSDSLADRFKVVLPVAYEDNVYDFVRDDELGVQTYVLAKQSYSDANLQSVQGVDHNVTTKEILAVRYTRDLRSMTAQAAGAPHVAIGNLSIAADLGTPGLKGIVDPTYGREALAWLRQRAIDIADR